MENAVRLFLFTGKVKDLVKATRRLAEIEKGPSAATERAHNKLY